jgi:hypothetical protein
VASMEKLLRSDGREYGSLVVFGSMKKRESRLLETSANEANSTLISYLPGPGAAGPGYRVGGFLEPCLSGRAIFSTSSPRTTIPPPSTAWTSWDTESSPR